MIDGDGMVIAGRSDGNMYKAHDIAGAEPAVTPSAHSHDIPWGG